MLSIGMPFPAFNLIAVNSIDPNSAFHDLQHTDYAGQWKLIFFWPRDFTFVCPTEIVGFGKLHDEFQRRNTQVIGASTDSQYAHLAWRQQHPQLKNNPLPWLADNKKELSRALGILNEENGAAHRATFIVDPDNIIRHVSVNDKMVGRNPTEMLRILDALQTGELCPCSWEPGQDTLK
jgi:peroxiredoxin (alkyl hydroperoxide reductase subunit C)